MPLPLRYPLSLRYLAQALSAGASDAEALHCSRYPAPVEPSYLGNTRCTVHTLIKTHGPGKDSVPDLGAEIEDDSYDTSDDDTDMGSEDGESEGCTEAGHTTGFADAARLFQQKQDTSSPVYMCYKLFFIPFPQNHKALTLKP